MRRTHKARSEGGVGSDAALVGVGRWHCHRLGGDRHGLVGDVPVADAATGDMLVFVDVDCIPAPDFISGYLDRMADRRGLFMGEVMYLPLGGTDGGLDFDRFADIAVKHSDRQGPPASGVAACADYRCFWSLNFAMWRQDWLDSPRFDESFSGYGGEDTDFGRAWSDGG